MPVAEHSLIAHEWLGLSKGNDARVLPGIGRRISQRATKLGQVLD